ncbi:MAG: hypothetical protein ACKOCH_07220, partial [Bacteroidota bacterium]
KYLSSHTGYSRLALGGVQRSNPALPYAYKILGFGAVLQKKCDRTGYRKGIYFWSSWMGEG